MRRLLAVARFTFLEGVRARFFAGVVVTGLIVAALGTVLASVPYGRVDQLMGRIGWSVVFVTGLIVSVFFAIGVQARERERRILHLFLSKPVTRGQYALGKFLGIWLLTTIAVLGEGLLILLLIRLLGVEELRFGGQWLLPAVGVVLKCSVLLAFALWMGSFTAPMVAFLASITYYLLGAGSEEFYRFLVRGELEELAWLGNLFRWLAPQFGRFDPVAWGIYQIDLVPAAYGWMVAYYGGYLLILLAAYVVTFSLQEL